MHALKAFPLPDGRQEYQTRALHERVLAESAALAVMEPRHSQELARTAELAAE